MIVVNNIGKTDDYVYDISLDGTVVNALGLNVLSNTDGFNFQKPLKYRYTESHPYIGKGLGDSSTMLPPSFPLFGPKYKCESVDFNTLSE